MEEILPFLTEDIGIGDITTNIMVDDIEGSAFIVCEEDAIVAGLEEAQRIFKHLRVKSSKLVEDGDFVSGNTKIMTLEGNLRNIITGERTALNFLMRMSGIATYTNSIVDKVRPINPNVRIAATRKTTPGFRYYEKKAVTLGGGWSHRMRLDDMVLIKDNHIVACKGLKGALDKIKNIPKDIPIEVEVTTIEEAEMAAKYDINIIMADNFNPENSRKLYEIVKEINENILVEISGNIDSYNIIDYAEYADIISIGALTHSVKAIQYSMDIIGSK